MCSIDSGWRIKVFVLMNNANATCNAMPLV
jgi:hypothetical protein